MTTNYDNASNVLYITYIHQQGFFSKFLMGGGGLKIFGPRWSPTGTKSDGGGDLRKKSD